MQKILAIDDKLDNLVSLSALLKNLLPGCTVITAQSGMEGIEKAKAEFPDAILLDVKMPGMDGFETCRRLATGESTKHIPVIMLTATTTDPRSLIEGLECGANAFLTKPINQYELVSQVKVALRIKKAEDALRKEKESLDRMVEERTAALREEITARKRAEAELREKSILNQTLLDAFPCVALLLRPQTREIIASNAAAVKIGAVPGRHCFSTWGQRQEPCPWCLAPAAWATGEACQSEVEALGIFWEAHWIPVANDLYMHFAMDITDRKKSEERFQQTLESLRKAVGATVQVMVSAVETRDPYTAGHQFRSADIARAIATEMGLDQDRIEAIRIASSIHDIGKLSIPAEILSKPTKLSEIEFSLIKEHAQRGYEILQNVESSWPLAEIVYQHHERMDGSGYPRKLKGEEILLEARILVVADVVEAMASHRPYRPGLGIDAALEEIESNKGTLYDSAVAAACLRLFREKGFQLLAR